MRRIFLIFALVLQCLAAVSQSAPNDLKISILTCAHGDEIYSSFGHCAFRATCPSRGIDKVYNYGTFNFRQPYFVLKFARGFLDYAVSAYGYERFCVEYIRDGRKVVEQDLNLSPEQIQAMYDFLEWNAREENRYYKYNFLEDNCATKIRDVIKNACGDNVVFPDSTYKFTLRHAINERIEEMPWFRLGITLLMGMPVERKANSMSAMFLPDYVYSTLADTKIRNQEGSMVPLVRQERVVIPADKPVDRTDWLTYMSPSLVFWLTFAALALATFYEVKNGTYHAGIDKTVLCITGLFGMLFMAMWFLTEHTVTAWNLNLLWAWPIHIVAAWYVRSNGAFWTKYFKAAAIITATLTIAGPIMPQHYDAAFYPILMILVLRLTRIAFCKR